MRLAHVTWRKPESTTHCDYSAPPAAPLIGMGRLTKLTPASHDHRKTERGSCAPFCGPGNETMTSSLDMLPLEGMLLLL